jgi:hypothetical protein
LMLSLLLCCLMLMQRQTALLTSACS